MQGKLAEQAAKLDLQKQKLDEQEALLDEFQGIMLAQQEQLDKIIGIKTELIEDIREECERSALQVSIDEKTGAISMDSSILFEYNKDELKKSGQEFLGDFLPKYMHILLSPKYRPYISEIVIEGHTDTSGTYLFNLGLSQERAYSVADYCLNEKSTFLSKDEKETLQSFLTTSGRSYSDPVLKADGTVDPVIVVQYLDEALVENQDYKVFAEALDFVTTYLAKKIAEELDASIKAFKDKLRTRLAELNELLNKHMHSKIARGTNYSIWLKSHKPFHWLGEFYQIIQANGGFDVIIGNPPYVEHSSNDVNYSLSHLKSANCGNLYGNCIERGLTICSKAGKFSFIIPVAITCSKRMDKVISMLKSQSELILFSNFDDRPGKLFEMIEHLRATIFIASISSNQRNHSIFATKYNRWYSEHRNLLFKNKK